MREAHWNAAVAHQTPRMLLGASWVVFRLYNPSCKSSWLSFHQVELARVVTVGDCLSYISEVRSYT